MNTGQKLSIFCSFVSVTGQIKDFEGSVQMLELGLEEDSAEGMG